MSPLSAAAAVLLLAGGGLLAWELRPGSTNPPSGQQVHGQGTDSRATPASTSARSPASEEELPPEATTKYPPYSMVPLHLPKVKSGIRCPDGSYLPLLNGVPHAPGISRADWLGPIAPVVAKHVDATGCEWWVHADTSTTTSRFIDTFDAQGKRIPNIETVHGALVPKGYVMPTQSPDLDPAGKPGPKPKGAGSVVDPAK